MLPSSSVFTMSSPGYFEEKQNAHSHVQRVDAATVDVAAELTAGSDGVVDPQEAQRVRYGLPLFRDYCTDSTNHIRVSDGR